MKDFIHIIHSDFSRNIGKDLKWFEYRLKIFENFTLRSLVNQTNDDFYYVMYLRKCFPEKLVPQLKGVLMQSGLRYLIIYYDKENDLKKKITTSLPNAKYIYDTRIDFDDLFHKDAVKEIQSYKFKWRRALIYQKGFCYDCVNKRMRYHFIDCPPFHTIMYPYEIYLNINTASEYRGTINGHDTVKAGMNSVILSPNKYIVLFHGKNNRSRYTEKIEKHLRTIQQEDHENILKNFNITQETWEELKI